MSNRALIFLAGEDLTGKEGVPLKLSNGTLVMCDAVTDACIGVCTRGAAAGAEAEVTIFGDAPVRVTAAVSRGQHATLAADGESCVGGLDSGKVQIGLFLLPGDSGDLVPAFINAPLRYEEG
jgi:hypothetical protein